MKDGDLVKDWGTGQFGIAIEIIDDLEVPPVVRVFWEDGSTGKEWTDDLEVIR